MSEPKPKNISDDWEDMGPAAVSARKMIELGGNLPISHQAIGELNDWLKSFDNVNGAPALLLAYSKEDKSWSDPEHFEIVDLNFMGAPKVGLESLSYEKGVDDSGYTVVLSLFDEHNDFLTPPDFLESLWALEDLNDTGIDPDDAASVHVFFPLEGEAIAIPYIMLVGHEGSRREYPYGYLGSYLQSHDEDPLMNPIYKLTDAEIQGVVKVVTESRPTEIQYPLSKVRP